LNINEYNDWFLPSKDELNWMYKNLKAKGLGGFTNDWYWSSSQDSDITRADNTTYAYAQRFDPTVQNGGWQWIGVKNYTYCVRAIRAF
jgi:hypothetical protein